MITMRTMVSPSFGGDPVCDLKDPFALAVAGWSWFFHCTLQGCHQHSPGTQTHVDGERRGCRCVCVATSRPTITRQQDGRRVCGLFPMEGLEFQGFFFFVIQKHCQRNMDDFSNFPLGPFFFLFFWLELTIIDRRLRRPISIPSFW